MKRCPFCGEYIQDAAIKCRHCKEWLNKKPQSGSKVAPASINTAEQRKAYKDYLAQKHESDEDNKWMRWLGFTVWSVMIFAVTIFFMAARYNFTRYGVVLGGEMFGYCMQLSVVEYLGIRGMFVWFVDFDGFNRRIGSLFLWVFTATCIIGLIFFDLEAKNKAGFEIFFGMLTFLSLIIGGISYIVWKIKNR